MDQKNGNGPLPTGLVAPPPTVVSQDQAIQIVEGALGPTFTLVLQGIRSTMPGVPVPIIMLAACKVLGHLVGGTFAGVNAPIAPLMKARTDCKDMFEKAIREVPVTSAGGSNAPAVPLPPSFKPRG